MEPSTTTEPDFPALAISLLGAPYLQGGLTPKGFDCWGLVRFLHLAEHGVELPEYVRGDLRGNTESIKGGLDLWQEIPAPQPGCVVALSRSKIVHHVGYWLEKRGGLCLHASAEMGGVVAHNLQDLREANFSLQKFYIYHG